MSDPILTLFRNINNHGQAKKLFNEIFFGTRHNLMYRRHLQGKTLREIGKEFHVSHEWVRQKIQEIEEEGGEKNAPL